MADLAPRRIVILGAAGRDFHNFNTVFRDDTRTRVVAFTAAQIPGIAGRRYPPSLAGPRYPEGIPIFEEGELDALIPREGIEAAVFAYSDVPHEQVMHIASRVLAAGADFEILGPDRTMLRADVPVVAVCAVRTGCGKSQLSRWIGRRLRDHGLRVAVLRHPMPYGDLAQQSVQRFASRADLDAANCTIEEREEYEPHLEAGHVVYAGVDYAAILERAQSEADIVIWDGGNNDFPFLRPDLLIAVADALRPGHATAYHPGETVLRMADAVVINKVDSATAAQREQVAGEIRHANPRARLLYAASPVTVAPEDEAMIRGRRVLVVEDGPTVTHGGMASGAGLVAARSLGATPVDPRDVAVGALRDLYRQYPHLGPVLGYGEAQRRDLFATIEAAQPEAILAATPIDLEALMAPGLPVVRARYEFAEPGPDLVAPDAPTLTATIDEFAEWVSGGRTPAPK